jgi:transposase
MKITKLINNYKFSSIEIEIIKRYRDNQEDADLRGRFLVLLLIAQKTALSVIAVTLGISEKTIKKWFKIYIIKGIDKLNSFHYKPKKTKINKEQISELVKWVKDTRPPSAKVVRLYIEDKFGINYSDDAVRKLLIKNGLKVLRPKLIPGNPPTEEEQKRFVEEYREIRLFTKAGAAVLFCDAMHLIHQTVPSYCWGDPKNPPIFRTNSGRQRLNILGAYDPIRFNIVHHTTETNCNYEQVILFFEKIYEKYNKFAFIILILDNAPYFHAKEVQEWLNKHPAIICRFLPAYAPNLNLIERFWGFVKEKLVKNIYFEKYKTFRCNVFRLLNHLSDYKKELVALMTENFQIIKYPNANIMPELTKI